MMGTNKETRVWGTSISDHQRVRLPAGSSAGTSAAGSRGQTEAQWPPRVRVLFIIGASLALWAIIFTVLLWTIG
jgi:hypothetical protein